MFTPMKELMFGKGPVTDRISFSIDLGAKFKKRSFVFYNRDFFADLLIHFNGVINPFIPALMEMGVSGSTELSSVSFFFNQILEE